MPKLVADNEVKLPRIFALLRKLGIDDDEAARQQLGGECIEHAARLQNINVGYVSDPELGGGDLDPLIEVGKLAFRNFQPIPLNMRQMKGMGDQDEDQRQTAVEQPDDGDDQQQPTDAREDDPDDEERRFLGRAKARIEHFGGPFERLAIAAGKQHSIPTRVDLVHGPCMMCAYCSLQ